jgi:pilus assembly protein CpaB
MNRNRILVISAVALLLAVLVTFFVYRTIQTRIQPPEQTVQIVVAAEKLALGNRLTETNVRLAKWPKSIPLDGTFNDIKAVLERGVIIGMSPNEPILDSKLAPKEAGSGLASVIPDGMRAMAVKVNDVIGVAGFVLPGTRVDVIITGTPKDNEEQASKVFLENVQVVAAGQNVQQEVNGKPQTVQVVTLLVTPEQAQDLALAQGNGQIQLALRNPLDTEHKNPEAAKRTSLFFKGQPAEAPKTPVAAAPKPVKAKPKAAVPVEQTKAVAPPAPQPEKKVIVDIFLGGKKETVTFNQEK